MKYVPFFAVFLLLLWPDLVDAAKLVPCDGVDCSACDFAKMGNLVLVWLIGLLFVIFAVIAAIAGFGMVTSGGNPQALTDAKAKMTNAVVGIVIVLAAWLLVDTVMKGLLAGGTGQISGYGPWSEVKCQTQTLLSPVVPSGSAPTNPFGLSETAALAEFKSAGVQVVSSGACTDPTRSVCTGVAGMQQSTIDGIKSLSAACPECGITVTAGTEVGHTNVCHQAGTCADVDCRPADRSNKCSVSQINKIYESAPNAVYEVKTPERREELIESGVNPEAVDVVEWISGEHFSLYK